MSGNISTLTVNEIQYYAHKNEEHALFYYIKWIELMRFNIGFTDVLRIQFLTNEYHNQILNLIISNCDHLTNL